MFCKKEREKKEKKKEFKKKKKKKVHSRILATAVFVENGSVHRE